MKIFNKAQNQPMPPASCQQTLILKPIHPVVAEILIELVLRTEPFNQVLTEVTIHQDMSDLLIQQVLTKVPIHPVQTKLIIKLVSLRTNSASSGWGSHSFSSNRINHSVKFQKR